MKKFYIWFSIILLSTYSANAQVNLPYTLNFTSGAGFSGDIARDGQGGTQDINDLNIEIYPASSSDVNTPLSGFTMVWNDNDNYWYSDDPSFTGIGPDYGPNTGVPLLIIKSDNSAHPFSLKSMDMYDWGGTSPWTFSTYRNGNFVGSVDVNFEQSPLWLPAKISQSDVLTPAYFQDIDEIRIQGPTGTNIYPAINNLALAAAITLPVDLIRFDGKLRNNMVDLEWQSGLETALSRYEIEQSGDAETFTTVSSVDAKGSNSSYQQSVKLLFNTGYFRLKLIDQNNHFRYSGILKVSGGNDDIFSVYPIPAVDFIHVQLSKNTQGAIFDISGRLIKRIDLKEGTNQVNIGQLLSGIYYLAAGDRKIKFIKK